MRRLLPAGLPIVDDLGRDVTIPTKDRNADEILTEHHRAGFIIPRPDTQIATKEVPVVVETLEVAMSRIRLLCVLLCAAGAVACSEGTGPTTGLSWASVSAGNQHTCALTTDGAAYCWGGNYDGQLGDGTTGNSRTRPGAVLGGLVFRAISAGDQHSCALTTGGAAYCWGLNFSGQLGDGSTGGSRTSPVAVSGGLAFQSISAGSDYTCALTAAGAAYCWGSNASAHLGDGTTTDRLSPAAVAGGHVFQTLSSGQGHTCALTATGAAYCWGDNYSGQSGDGTFGNVRTSPVAVSGGFVFRSISVGNEDTCGLTTGGAAYCWGVNAWGQVGDGTNTSGRLIPTLPVTGGLSFQAISQGFFQTCGLTAGGAAYCWGSNASGVLGDGTSTDRFVPGAVSGGLAFQDISTGPSHTCGLTAGGAAYCWGYNHDGELGDGSTTDRHTPAAVRSP